MTIHPRDGQIFEPVGHIHDRNLFADRTMVYKTKYEMNRWKIFISSISTTIPLPSLSPLLSPAGGSSNTFRNLVDRNSSPLASSQSYYLINDQELGIQVPTALLIKQQWRAIYCNSARTVSPTLDLLSPTKFEISIHLAPGVYIDKHCVNVLA